MTKLTFQSHSAVEIDGILVRDADGGVEVPADGRRRLSGSDGGGSGHRSPTLRSQVVPNGVVENP